MQLKTDLSLVIWDHPSQNNSTTEEACADWRIVQKTGQSVTEQSTFKLLLLFSDSFSPAKEHCILSGSEFLFSP